MAQFDFIMSEPVEDVEEGSEHEDVDGLPLGLRDSCLVTAAGDQLEEVPGSFCVDVKVRDLTQAIPVIPIVVVGGRLLVALPSPVWHRSPTQRILPAGALIKPALAMFAGSFLEILPRRQVRASRSRSGSLMHPLNWRPRSDPRRQRTCWSPLLQTRTAKLVFPLRHP